MTEHMHAFMSELKTNRETCVSVLSIIFSVWPLGFCRVTDALLLQLLACSQSSAVGLGSFIFSTFPADVMEGGL